ncbi:1-phosphofructokinase family hexose kinase [Planctomicrobium sp. SH664]|uniref:1-phosphofructokinase family hexose kinase n=1 Tax=Planctomicrobium sp. SH664 TaxID=3448125 RepID=UPI003F5C8ED8
MILAAGLSPALQQILQFDSLRIGDVNRARGAEWCASGKVINVAVAACHLGVETAAVTTRGGQSGDALAADLFLFPLHMEWIQSRQPTRVCTTLLDADGVTTELVENTGPVEDAVLSCFASHWQALSRTASLAVFSGSLPPNVPPEFFAQFLQSTSIRTILDLQGEPLRKCLPGKPFLIKPNREELAATCGRSLNTSAAVVSAMQECRDAGADWIVVTDGPRLVHVMSQQSTYRLRPPQVRTVNPTGCGDCLAAGIAVALHRGDDPLMAIRFGIGAAAQNAEQLLPGRLTMDRCQELAAQVVIESEE